MTDGLTSLNVLHLDSTRIPPREYYASYQNLVNKYVINVRNLDDTVSPFALNVITPSEEVSS